MHVQDTVRKVSSLLPQRKRALTPCTPVRFPIRQAKEASLQEKMLKSEAAFKEKLSKAEEAHKETVKVGALGGHDQNNNYIRVKR